MLDDIDKLLEKPTTDEIAKMTFDEMVKRKTFAYKAAVANGTNAERLLSGLYKDPTHFIYELLQNAEDTKATEVKIILENEKLVFSHNGHPFNNRDTWSILGIDESTKNEEEKITQIGRFGIGFKAVFGICEIPKIYSGEFNFKIRNFYVPEKLEKKSEYDNNKTYIVLLFKENDIQRIFNLIENTLSKLNPDTILFLRHIEKIDYSTPKFSGFFEKKRHTRNSNENEYIECDILGRKGLEAKYYLFERPLKRNNKLISSIAYRINEEKTKIISEEESTKLVVFFPTETNTFLKFKV